MRFTNKIPITLTIVILAALILIMAEETPGDTLPVEPMSLLRGVVIGGDLAYVKDRYRNIYVVDISDPLSPQQDSVLTPSDGENWEAIDATANRLYIFGFWLEYDSSGGYIRHNIVHIYDTADPSMPNHLAQFEAERTSPPQWIRATADNQYVYLGYNGDPGVTVYDVSDLSAIQKTSSFLEVCVPHTLRLTFQHAYVKTINCGTTEGTSLMIYDIGDPTNPILVSNYKLEILTRDVHAYDVTEPTLYIVTLPEEDPDSYYLKTINVTDPINPVFLDQKRLDRGDDSYSIFAVEEDQGWLYVPGEQRIPEIWLDTKVYDVPEPGEMLFLKHLLEKEIGTLSTYGAVGKGCVFWVNRYDSPYRLRTVCMADYVGNAITPTPTITALQRYYLPLVTVP